MWQETVLYSPIFQFVVSQGPHVVIQCTVVNVRFLIILQEASNEQRTWTSQNTSTTVFTNRQGVSFVVMRRLPRIRSTLSGCEASLHSHGLSWGAAPPVLASLICLTCCREALTSTAGSPHTFSEYSWILIGYSSLPVFCICTSIPAILWSSVVLPYVEWNSCDLKIMIGNVQELCWCSTYSHKKNIREQQTGNITL